MQSEMIAFFHTIFLSIFSICLALINLTEQQGEIEFMSYVHAMVVGNTKKDTLMPIISQFVEEGTTVFTDELQN